MGKQIYTCDQCGAEYNSAWACAYCCDESAYGDTD